MQEDWTEADQGLDAFKEEVRLLVDRDLQAAPGTAVSQPTIYHYTDVKSALEILKTGHLWFTERAHLNDPVEIRYGFDVAHKRFEDAAKNRGAAIPEDAALHLKGEHGFWLSSYGYGVWIASFSLAGDDLGQWRSYADDGRGVCLGFSIDNFDMPNLAKHMPNGPNSFRFPVNYCEQILCGRLKPYIESSLDILQKAKIHARQSYYTRYGRALLYERDLFQILNNGLFVNALLSKHPAYNHEHEYRLLISGLHEPIVRCEHHHLRERKGEIVGYLDLPIPNWKQSGVLTHIRLGPAASDELGNQIPVALVTLGIPVPKIDKSVIPYRSTR